MFMDMRNHLISNSILLSYDYYYVKGHAPNARIMLPDKVVIDIIHFVVVAHFKQESFKHIWETVKVLGLDFPDVPIEFLPVPGKRFARSPSLSILISLKIQVPQPAQHPVDADEQRRGVQ